MKNEGEGLFEAIEEVIDCAKDRGTGGNSHHKAVGAELRCLRSLEMISEARRKGLRITADVYPYEFAQASSLASMAGDVWKKLLGGSRKEDNDAIGFPSVEEMQAFFKDRSNEEKVRNLPELNAALPRSAIT